MKGTDVAIACHIRIVGVPGNACPHATGHVEAISRHGIGRYRLHVEGPVVTAETVARSKRLLFGVLAGVADGLIHIEVRDGNEQRTDLLPDEEIRVTYATRAPYAPGEKLTDRHPDSVIAQVVEGTIEKRVAHLAQQIKVRKVRSPYAPLPAPTEPAFRLSSPPGRTWIEPVEYASPARPDGFDQRRIDDIKTMMLATSTAKRRPDQ